MKAVMKYCENRMTLNEAIKYCEEHDCEECSVDDKRTDYQKKVLQYPCCWNLVDEENKNESNNDI